MTEKKTAIDTAEQLKKLDEQLEGQKKILADAEENIAKIQGRIKKYKQTIAEIEAKRSAIVGSKIIALGYDNAADLDKLYALAKQQKADEQSTEENVQTPTEEAPVTFENETIAENEGAMY